MPFDTVSLKQTVGVPSVGDVLVTSVGTIGNVWICDGREFYYKDGNITQICKNGSLIPEYVELFIHSPLFEQQAISTVAGTAYQATHFPATGIDARGRKTTMLYDVFISHANADKIEYVDQLKQSLDKLRIGVFYDKDTLEWGDKWKDKILEGVKQAEFAIIVISENFFGREWTEKELHEFLNRQNSSGQKIILPILHNITAAQLKEKYPAVADIQGLSSENYSCDEIALLFAGQLIKRLKA